MKKDKRPRWEKKAKAFSSRPRGGLVPLGSILRETLRRSDFETPVARHQIWELWDELVGPSIAQVARPESLRFSTLCVMVSDSTWMQHLAFMRSALLRRIHERLGPNSIANIYFRLKEDRGSAAGETSDSQPQRA